MHSTNPSISPVSGELISVAPETSEINIDHLMPSDESWLRNLAGRDFDTDELERLNILVGTDTRLNAAGIDETSEEAALTARDEFYGEAMGFGAANHPLHKAYMSTLGRKDGKHYMGPISTFVKTQRFLASEGLDNARLLSGYPPIFRLRADKLPERIAVLKDFGIDPIKACNRRPHVIATSATTLMKSLLRLEQLEVNVANLINRFPAILTYEEDRAEKRILAARRVTKALGWENNSDKLIETLPAVLGYGEQKLKTHARLFAEHGRKDLTVNNVASMIIAPLDLHIIALGSGKPYTLSSLAKLQQTIPASDRRAIANEMLLAPEIEADLGKKVIREYVRYTESR